MQACNVAFKHGLLSGLYYGGIVGVGASIYHRKLRFIPKYAIGWGVTYGVLLGASAWFRFELWRVRLKGNDFLDNYMKHLFKTVNQSSLLLIFSFLTLPSGYFQFYESLRHLLYNFFFGRRRVSHPRWVLELGDQGTLSRLESQTKLYQTFEFLTQRLETRVQSRLNLLPEGLGVVLDQHQIVFVLISRFLKWCLPCNHIEQNDAQRKHICLSRLVMHLQVNLRWHVVNGANKSFWIFIEVGSEDKVRNLHIEILFVVDE